MVDMGDDYDVSQIITAFRHKVILNCFWVARGSRKVIKVTKRRKKNNLEVFLLAPTERDCGALGEKQKVYHLCIIPDTRNIRQGGRIRADFAEGHSRL